MYETIKIVNNHTIRRMVGTRGFYEVIIAKTATGLVFKTFRTIKAATAYCETL